MCSWQGEGAGSAGAQGGGAAARGRDGGEAAEVRGGGPGELSGSPGLLLVLYLRMFAYLYNTRFHKHTRNEK